MICATEKNDSRWGAWERWAVRVRGMNGVVRGVSVRRGQVSTDVRWRGPSQGE